MKRGAGRSAWNDRHVGNEKAKIVEAAGSNPAPSTTINIDIPSI